MLIECVYDLNEKSVLYVTLRLSNAFLSFFVSISSTLLQYFTYSLWAKGHNFLPFVIEII